MEIILGFQLEVIPWNLVTSIEAIQTIKEQKHITQRIWDPLITLKVWQGHYFPAYVNFWRFKEINRHYIRDSFRKGGMLSKQQKRAATGFWRLQSARIDHIQVSPVNFQTPEQEFGRGPQIQRNQHHKLSIKENRMGAVQVYVSHEKLHIAKGMTTMPFLPLNDGPTDCPLTAS